jgi:hypothetical protein
VEDGVLGVGREVREGAGRNAGLAADLVDEVGEIHNLEILFVLILIIVFVCSGAVRVRDEDKD